MSSVPELAKRLAETFDTSHGSGPPRSWDNTYRGLHMATSAFSSQGMGRPGWIDPAYTWSQSTSPYKSYPEVAIYTDDLLLRLQEFTDETSQYLYYFCGLNRHMVDAEALLSTAFARAEAKHFRCYRADLRGTPVAGAAWHAWVVSDTLARLKNVRNALVHEVAVTERAQPWALLAFHSAAQLTDARALLVEMSTYNVGQAFKELSNHLHLTQKQLEMTADLVLQIEAAKGASSDGDGESDQARFERLRDKVLAGAGDLLTASAAAAWLGTTRQNVHKRIKAGSVLGVMRGTEVVVPAGQFVPDGNGKSVVVDGLTALVKLFDKANAGRLAALQFLTQHDENLAAVPLAALKVGRADDVLWAATAYLSLNEG